MVQNRHKCLIKNSVVLSGEQEDAPVSHMPDKFPSVLGQAIPSQLIN